jgi:hypothetical protein
VMGEVVDPGALPPPQEGGFVDALAVLAVVAGALSVLFVVVSLVVLANGGPRREGGVVETHPAGTIAVLAPAACVFGVTAWGLRRRRRWAWWAIAIELAAAIGLLGLSVGMLAQSHDQTDSNAMAGMSAIVCGLGLLVLLIVAMLPPTRREFRPPVAGWYPDPGGRRLRWWDGHRWTDHVAD